MAGDHIRRYILEFIADSAIIRASILLASNPGRYRPGLEASILLSGHFCSRGAANL